MATAVQSCGTWVAVVMCARRQHILVYDPKHEGAAHVGVTQMWASVMTALHANTAYQVQRVNKGCVDQKEGGIPVLVAKHDPIQPGQDAAMVVGALAAYVNHARWDPVPTPEDAWTYAWNTVQIFARRTCGPLQQVKWHRPEYPPPQPGKGGASARDGGGGGAQNMNTTGVPGGEGAGGEQRAIVRKAVQRTLEKQLEHDVVMGTVHSSTMSPALMAAAIHTRTE